MRLTVGPLPPAVYWRRRAIVLGAVLVALFLVAQACMSASASSEGRSGGEAPPSGTPPPVAGQSSAPPESPAGSPPAGQPVGQPDDEPGGEDDPEPVDPAEAPDPPAEGGCADQDMLITAVADPDSFSQGDAARFTIRIRNDSAESCRRDIGGDRRELYLRRGSGASKVWSSRECGAPTGTDVLELPPAFEREHYLVWNGRASDSCDDAGEAAGELVPAGEYELVARLGTAYSDPLPVTIR